MIVVKTAKPVAIDSPDHITPVGTKNDNSKHRGFNERLYRLIPSGQVRLLDIGCAGGGLVKSIIDDGGFAIGIEGSDYSLVRKRAEWGTIPDNLFTADATEPFEIEENYTIPGVFSFLPLFRIVRFNVVTAWEFWEHIADHKIAAVAENIRRHMIPDGFFIGSIADKPDVQNHIVTNLHQTVQPIEWWRERFESLGFERAEYLEQHFAGATVRDGNPIALVLPGGKPPLKPENS